MYGELTGLRPDDATLHLNLSIALGNSDRFDEALAASERACELRPGIAEHQAQAGYLLRDFLGRPGEAAQRFERAAKAQPQNARWPAELALTLAAAGRPAEALEAAERALARDAASLAAWRAKALALGTRGDHAAAVLAIGKAVEIAPRDPNIRMEEARWLAAAGDAARARRVFDTFAAKARPDDHSGVVEQALAALEEAEGRR